LLGDGRSAEGPGKDADERDTYLDRGKEPLGIVSQFQRNTSTGIPGDAHLVKSRFARRHDS
jgi:hypothetical protein